MSTVFNLYLIYMSVFKKITLFAVFFLPLLSMADDAISIEDLTVDDKEWSFNLSLAYLNSSNDQTLSAPTFIQSGNTLIPVVANVIDAQINSDTFLFTPGIRYGVTKKLEVSLNASFISTDNRFTQTSLNDIPLMEDSGFREARVGINYIFRENTDSFAIIGFADAQLLTELPDGSTDSGNSITFGSTIYQVFDPISLSLTAAVSLNDEITLDNDDGTVQIQDVGNAISISPTLSFAVNDQITLITGLTWRLQDGVKVNGEEVSNRNTSTGIRLGMGAGIDRNNTIQFNVAPSVSGDNNVQVSFNWLKRF